ncbi:hypothetical protein GQ600_13115 [Phytophthora cactorum]|nr:hypothetical protein GQ600_13115 [Phytophthora cactorum]
MSISIHLTTTALNGSSSVGSTILANTAAALKSLRYDALIRIDSRVGLTMPNMFSSRVPCSGPAISISASHVNVLVAVQVLFILFEPGQHESIGDINELATVFGRQLQVPEGIHCESLVTHSDTIISADASAAT